MRLPFILFLILYTVSNCFSQTKPLEFNDGSQILMIGGAADQRNYTDTGRILRKELTAVYTGLGRASWRNPSGQFPANSAAVRAAKLTKKQKNVLFAKIDRIDTAYSFKQGEIEFYLNGFNSINLRRLDDCDHCEIKLRLIVLESKADGKFYYSPYIESIEQIKNAR